MDSKLQELISTISRIKGANQLPHYINYIQFPYFRNIELDQRINFDFPLTVFIGPNGSGKSSTLHALYGCPEGTTPYDFWFSTEIDPVEYILESRKLRHSFFYEYKKDSGESIQVVKARIKRKDNPNYWETSRPLVSYGMIKLPDNRKRNEPIKKNVVYLDFRSELSAFDKYFYFETPPPNLKSKTKQDYLRKKSKLLRQIFDGTRKVIKSSSGHQNNKPLVELKDEELKAISDILGKIYVEGKVLHHKYFHNWGYSILLKTKFHQYSEAFAGSGEMSAVRLVKNILDAKEGSLILLDEPEVSLHPGAQSRLKQFLLEQIKKKKHQIVISTHSSSIIDGLPKEAIKVFSQREDSGKFIVKENILPEEAFYFIGQQLDEKLNLIVEDKLAKKIIEKILEKLGPEVKNRFIIRPLPGGAETINKHYIPVYCNTNNNMYFFILDGDKKRVDNLFDVMTLQEQDKNERFLNEKIKEQTGCDIKFLVDGNADGGLITQRIDMMIEFLKYYKEHVRYLPMNMPEDFIWSDEIVRQKLNTTDFEQKIDFINTQLSSKQRIYETAKIFFGVDNQNEAFEDMLINEWIKKEDQNFILIKNMLERL